MWTPGELFRASWAAQNPPHYSPGGSNMSTGIQEQKETLRRVPKPLMEKRRRDRINHSLETLRLLLLESTCNEKLKNPKVEKAEILESVVNFLRAEQQSRPHPYSVKRGKRGHADYDDEIASPCKRHRSYQNGMRTCLLRVSQFISSKNQEMEEGLENVCGTLQQNIQDHSSQSHLVSASQLHHGSLMHLTQESNSPLQQSLTEITSPCTALDQPKLSQRTAIYEPTNKMTPTTKQTLMVADPVWRPWPQ